MIQRLEGHGDPRDIIEKWYQEKKFYNYSQPRGSFKTNSFSQIVWLSTKYLGFASVNCGDGIRIYVAKYWPPGNICGLFEENVLPLNEPQPQPPVFIDEYRTSILKYHNKLRKKHRCSKLRLSPELCQIAHEIAAFLIAIKMGKVTYGHHSKNGYIFNYLFSYKGKLPNPKTVCYVWYNTFYYFRYDSDDVLPESAPFREIVWSSTSEMGVGTAVADNFCVVITTYNRPPTTDQPIHRMIKRPLVMYPSLCKK